MHITNCGRGIHKREVAGVEVLKTKLPKDWFAFTNLDLAIGAGTAREIDVIIITNRRVLVVDLKDWTGAVTGSDGRWLRNGQDQGSSPVTKVAEVCRHLYVLLRDELARRPETRGWSVPKIDGLVVMTGDSDTSGLPAVERQKVMRVDEFVRILNDERLERENFGNIARDILAAPLVGLQWKPHITRFFNAGRNSPLQPGRRKFQRYTPEDHHVFEHPKHIYREYEAQEAGAPPSLGTLRLWDFANITDTRFQNGEHRSEITGRERRVFHWLRDRSDNVDRVLLNPLVDDPDEGVAYWEIYDRRRRLKRLSDWSVTETAGISPPGRIELARQFLSAVAEMHRLDAAHLDLGAHSVWLEAPTTVRLSHLFAARHPDVKSLGETRYHFLSSVGLPEDVVGGGKGPFQRDVFLAGGVVHRILFGAPPENDPPDWSASVDVNGTFAGLHHWFAEALDHDAGMRFHDAQVALEAFNKATVEHPTPQEVLVGLERFRTKTKSQLALLQRFPMIGDPISESDRLHVWKSKTTDDLVVVKMWKQAAWGTLETEGKRLLAFLEKAQDAMTDAPAGTPRIRAVLWLGDAFAVVQDWVEGTTLSMAIDTSPPRWPSGIMALKAIAGLEATVSRLHEAGYAHGDLKPDNIVVGGDDSFTLIDLLDFSPAVDGQLQNRAYSIGGDRYERDRYAVLQIASELLRQTDLPAESAATLARAIDECKTKEPRLSTMLPFASAVQNVVSGLAQPQPVQGRPGMKLAISIRNAEVGPMESDEGRFFARTYGRNELGGPGSLHIRGAFEELEVRFADDGAVRSAFRRQLGQTRIAIISRHERYSFEGELVVVDGTKNDYKGILEWLDNPEVFRALTASDVADVESTDENIPAVVPEEEAEESLSEELGSDDTGPELDLDVPRLWRELIDIEKELTTEAVVTADSSFDKVIRRHKVAMSLESGSFDFDRNDTVSVQTQSKGTWRRLGELDVTRSTSSGAFVEPMNAAANPSHGLMVPGQRIRFVSHFETESLRRRSGAVDRILAGQGRAGNLVSVFDPRSGATPHDAPHEVDEKQLGSYGLNADQASAFRKIVSVRPVGLLQGPPGTGKTKFIAALAHYAITKGLARNVLLSSQSHEAVNTAAEALLKLFRKSGGEPGILRVAFGDDQVSEPIRAFHTARVEQSIKDRFQATFNERIRLAGETLGVPYEVAADVVTYESHLMPVARRLAELRETPNGSDSRLEGLEATLSSVLQQMGLPEYLSEVIGDADFGLDALDALFDKHASSGISADKLDRLLAVARLGRDFVGSTSRQQRSFEPFLAGTRQIVVGTCVGLGRASLGLTSTAFDLVIVDEAARCTASELLVPLQAARWAVLVGDQKQLKPQHRAEVVDRVFERTKISKREIKRSDFGRIFETPFGARAGARLQTQYRMLEPIGRLVSETFYPDLKLVAGRSEGVVPEHALPKEFAKPLVWIDTQKLGEAAFDRKSGDTGSRVNKAEADIIIRMLERWRVHDGFVPWLESESEHPVGVGIICMYAAQRDLIRRHLLRSPLADYLDSHIKVGTVDSYQGKENPIVIVSLVRNNREGRTVDGSATIKEGFLTEPNRINVAASRAMDRLILVGSMAHWRPGGSMGKLVAGFDRAVYAASGSIIDGAAIEDVDHDKDIGSGGNG